MMKIPKTVSIIGGTGKMGQMFKKAFEKENIKVIISSRKTVISNIEAAKLGDIVIVTVPISKTIETIQEIVPFVKKNAMITDFTSVKINPVKAMKKNVLDDVEVVGGHPLFGPSVGFKGQNFILCKEKLNENDENSYYNWYKQFLENLGLKVIEMSAENHDKNMAVIQCLTHISNLSLGYTLQKLGFDLGCAQDLSTPVYLLRLYGAGRILAQDGELYSDIQIHNPYAKKMSEEYFNVAKELNEIVKSEDEEKFLDIFNKSKEYFGDFTDKSMQVTNKLIEVMKKDE